MKLHALHHDGFTELLLTWELTAEAGVAMVVGTWQDDVAQRRCIDFPFSDVRIQEFEKLLKRLKSKYDGNTDDCSSASLRISNGDEVYSTTIEFGFSFAECDRADVDAFSRLWRPLCREVEVLLGFPRAVKK